MTAELDPKDAAQAMLAACGIQPGDRYRHAHGYSVAVIALAVDQDDQPCVVCLGPDAVARAWELERFQERFVRERIAPRSARGEEHWP